MLSVMNITPGEIMIYLLTLAVFQFVRQDLWQRVWAADSIKIAGSGYIISMIVAVTIGAVAVAIGVLSRYGLELGNIDPVLVYSGVVVDVFLFPLVALLLSLFLDSSFP